MRNLISASKFLSLLLRHNPAKGNLVLDKNGWATVSDLCDPQKANFKLDDLTEIIKTDTKGRYEFNMDKTKVRAVQGHSIKDIEVEVEKAIPPAELYHGTKVDVRMLIARDGLLPMNRQFVHLSADLHTAKDVANRRKGQSIILVVDAAQMSAKGFKFFKAANGVWLTDSVPPEYLLEQNA
jgi:putative RNA 2'-phosphotransferase